VTRDVACHTHLFTRHCTQGPLAVARISVAGAIITQQLHHSCIVQTVSQVMTDRERARKRHEEQIVKFCAAIVTRAADDAVACSSARVKTSLSSSSAAALAGNSAADRLQWIDKYLQGSAEPVALPVIESLASSSAASNADDDASINSPLPIKKAPQPAPPPSIPALDAVRSKHQQTHLPTHFTADAKPSAPVVAASASSSSSGADVKPVQSSLSRRRAEAARVRCPIQHSLPPHER
jgi:hypothetical protein